MANDRERTACCGLYCGDCIPADEVLFDTTGRLRQQLEDCRFDEYATYKSTGNKTFDAYQVFREVLDAILALRCLTTCFHGGGRPDCAIRDCAHGKGLEGCWQCGDFETCDRLQSMSACHGDTVQHNLRMIRQHGVEHWSHARGQHYMWQKSGPQH
jgi:hypothetical protein